MEGINVGQLAPDFIYHTAEQESVHLWEKLQETDKTFLLFSRYLGCPFCQVDILELCASYSSFAERKAQVILILQSDRETLRSQTLVEKLPFDVACDPEMELYQLYGVKAAASMGKMLRPERKLFRKATKLLKWKLKHGAYEGNEQQLPALFLLDKERTVLYSHYASSISDLPDAEEMLKLL